MSTTAPRPGWPAFHGGILLAALGVEAICVPGLVWPWYLLLPVLGYAGTVLLVPSLRRSLPGISIGHIGWLSGSAGIIFSVVTATFLLAYQDLSHTDVKYLAVRVPISMCGSMLLAGLCFSIVNAALEELIFRWILYEALAAEWSVLLAIAATSIFFGIGHYDGYPPGWPGTLLAAGFGTGLALLRWWSGGLALSIACHVCADATIFWIIASATEP